MNLSTWETLSKLEQGYVRLLYPDGNVEDMHEVYIDAVKSSDRGVQVFSQNEWDGFLRERRFIDAQWKLRSAITGEDTKMLIEMGISWVDVVKARAWLDEEWTTVLIWQWGFQGVVKAHGTAEEKQRLKTMLKESAEETARQFAKERMELARRISRHQAPSEAPEDAMRRRAREYGQIALEFGEGD